MKTPGPGCVPATRLGTLRQGPLLAPYSGGEGQRGAPLDMRSRYPAMALAYSSWASAAKLSTWSATTGGRLLLNFLSWCFEDEHEKRSWEWGEYSQWFGAG